MTASNQRIAQGLCVRKNLAPFKPFFTKPTFKSFTGVVKSILKNTDNGGFAQFSQDIGKCISSGDSFQFIGDVHDTTDDRMKSGYEMFAAAVVSPGRNRRKTSLSGPRWI